MAIVSVLGILVALLLVTKALSVVQKAGAGTILYQDVFALLLLYVPEILLQMLPLATLLGSILALQRLQESNEWIAMQALGYQPAQLYQSLLGLLLPWVAVIAFATLYAMPTYHAFREQKWLAYEYRAFRTLQPGQFYQFKGFPYTLYIEKEGQNTDFEGVRLLSSNESILAKQADVLQDAEGNTVLRLFAGTLYHGSANQRQAVIAHFDRYERIMHLAPPAQPQLRRTRATTQLLHSSDPGDTAEWYQRISLPLSVCIIALFAYPLSVSQSLRSTKAARVLPATLLFIGYMYALSVTRKAIEFHGMPWVAGILPHGIFVAFWALLIFFQNRKYH